MIRLNSWTEGRQESLYFILNSKGSHYQVLSNENSIARFFLEGSFDGSGKIHWTEGQMKSDRPR